MSSKILTSAAGTYYTEDSSNVNSDGGGNVPVAWAWNGVGTNELSAITDSNDASWWAGVRPNSGDPDTATYGSMVIAEDLSQQIPWNSTINSVVVNWRAQRDNGSTGITFRPYVRQSGTGSKTTVYGANVNVTSTSVVEQSDTFSTDWGAAAWTIPTLYNDTLIGVLGKFLDGPGNHEGRLIKLYCTVNFTLPTPTLSAGSTTAVRGTSVDVQVTANANHSFTTMGTDGYRVTVSVEWGLTAAYGDSQNLSNSVNGSSDTTCSGTISGLSSGTTYHYRFKATDGDNTVTTGDSTFTTTMGDPILLSF